jgi:hypothetical protein
MVLKPRRGLSGDDFFINKHHRDVFRSRYEALYLEMQQYRPFAYYSRRPAWKNAMERLERELPKTFEDLCGHFADVEGSIL